MRLMNVSKRTIKQTKRFIVLGCSIMLVSGTGLAIEVPQQAYALQAEKQTNVYNHFQSLIRKPSTLGQARKYLINHIDEAGRWHATVMVLQLENALKAELDRSRERLYTEEFRQAMDAAYLKGGLTYTALLKNITNKKLYTQLVTYRDEGFAIRTSEGVYYPVIHYEGFKLFKPYVNNDIAAYIDIMATESNKGTITDAALAISWKELLSRALEMEKFMDSYQVSNRREAVKLKLWGAKARLLYGSSNTPAYDNTEYGGQAVLDSELRQAYEDAVANGTGSSSLLQMIEQLLKLLDNNGDQLTEGVQSYIDRYLEME